MNNSDLQNSVRGSKVKVIDSMWTFAIAVAFMGPFALPLLWRNPRFSLQTKQLATIAVVVATIILVWVSWASMKKTWNDIQELQKMLKGNTEL